MTIKSAKFAPGQVVHHRIFDYRGVIVDVDAEFQLTDEWYEKMAKSRPPKNQPWYRVLVEDSEHQTYVAEGSLEADETGQPLEHHQLKIYFQAFQGGRYPLKMRRN
jgi:heat shock protein HspQ